MERTRFIEHAGKRILLLDFRGMGESGEEVEAEVAKTKAIISRQPHGSVLALTDIRGAKITAGHVRTMHGLVEFNKPYVRWSAIVVGLTGVYLTAFRAVQAVSRRRNLRSFNDLEEAKNWLVSQP